MARKRKLKDKPEGDKETANIVTTRMLARCELCKREYVPRGRGGLEVTNLKLFYIPNDKLAQDKRGLICPAHKDKKEPAGLIISEDCLDNRFGAAMGMVGFLFSEDEVMTARQNQIWPGNKTTIELDAKAMSSLSDKELLKFVKSQIIGR